MTRREVARAEAVTSDHSGALADGGRQNMEILDTAPPIKHILFRLVVRKTWQLV